MPQKKAEEAEEASVTVMVAADVVAVEVAVASVAVAVPVEVTRMSGHLRPNLADSSSTDTLDLLRKSTPTPSPSRRHPSLTSSSRMQERASVTKS